jgi:hypothetical protein
LLFHVLKANPSLAHGLVTRHGRPPSFRTGYLAEIAELLLRTGYLFFLFSAETPAVRTNCIAWSTLISTGLIFALGTMTVKPPS